MTRKIVRLVGFWILAAIMACVVTSPTQYLVMGISIFLIMLTSYVVWNSL